MHYLTLICIAVILLHVTEAAVPSASPMRPCCGWGVKVANKIKSNGVKFDDTLKRSVISLGLIIDSFNGLTWLLAPTIARAAAGGLPAVAPSISSLLGVTFLSSAVARLTILSQGTEVNKTCGYINRI